jgi:hypothetical protein
LSATRKSKRRSANAEAHLAQSCGTLALPPSLQGQMCHVCTMSIPPPVVGCCAAPGACLRGLVPHPAPAYTALCLPTWPCAARGACLHGLVPHAAPAYRYLGLPVPGRVQHAVPAYYNYLLLPRACLLGLLGLLELLGLVPLGVSLGDFALQLVARERGRREGRRVSVGASGIRAETSRIRAGARQSAATVLDRAICRDYVRQGQGPCACTLTAHVP